MTEVNTLKESLKAICKEGETIKERYAKRMADNKIKFDAIFTQIWKIEPRGENDMNPFASTDEITAKAIEAAGLSDDNEITTAFKEHQKDYYSFYKLDKESIEINFQIAALLHQQKQPSIKTDGWQFKEINIVAPKQIQEEIIAPMIEDDAKEGNGLYGNITDIPEEDEDLDEWFDIEAYGIKCNLEPLYRELQNYGIVDSVLKNKEIREYYLKTIKSLIYFIRDNTDRPNKIRNYISKTLKELDDIVAFGLLLQILLLQGLIKWFEGVDLKESDKGYNEACTLIQWIGELLMEKEVRFCYYRWGEGDKEYLKPLGKYLLSTEIGKAVQKHLFEKQIEGNFIIDDKYGTKEISKETDKISLPSELDTESARKYFAKAIKVGYMERTNNGYKWLFGNNKGQARLGYFCYKVYSNPRPISKLEELFRVKKLSASITNAGVKAKRADVKQWRNEIDNNIFND